MIDPYAQIPELYDIEHSDFSDDIDMYLDFVVAAGDPVLDIGGGTGRIGLALAGRGYRVTILDRSAAMLRRADEAATRLGFGARVSLCESRMEELAACAEGPFGVAIIALDTLLHASTQREQLRTLLAARSALDRRGQLIVDVFNPTHRILQSFDGTVSLEGSWQLESGSTVEKFSARTLLEVPQQFETHVWYDVRDDAGQLKRTGARFRQRYVTAGELELMLRISGFGAWIAYGSYDLDELTSDSDRIVMAADVTA